MAGEFILKLLQDTTARIEYGRRWLVWGSVLNPQRFIVYESMPYQKDFRILIETEDEQLACQILRGK